MEFFMTYIEKMIWNDIDSFSLRGTVGPKRGNGLEWHVFTIADRSFECKIHSFTPDGAEILRMDMMPHCWDCRELSKSPAPGWLTRALTCTPTLRYLYSIWGLILKWPNLMWWPIGCAHISTPWAMAHFVPIQILQACGQVWFPEMVWSCEKWRLFHLLSMHIYWYLVLEDWLDWGMDGISCCLAMFVLVFVPFRHGDCDV